MPVLPNARHERFAQERAAGKTIDQAYLLAGYKANRSNASQLNAKQHIQDRIQHILNASAKKVQITQARVLEELGKIGFSDIRKMFDENGNLKRVQDLDDASAASVSAIEVVTRRVAGGEANEVEHVAKIKTWDKRAALVDIGKHLGMFKEGLPEPATVNVNIGDADLARLIVFQLTKAQKEA